MADDTNLYAVVEIMGRRTRAGVISDAQLGGATLLRIEHPTASDHSGAEPVTEYYASSAIFAIRPCSRDEAVQVASWAWRPSLPIQPELPAAFADLVDDEDENDDDDESYDRAGF
jgi:hypothetical protein